MLLFTNHVFIVLCKHSKNLHNICLLLSSYNHHINVVYITYCLYVNEAFVKI